LNINGVVLSVAAVGFVLMDSKSFLQELANNAMTRMNDAPVLFILYFTLLKFKGLKFNFYGYTKITGSRELRPLYALTVANAVDSFGIQVIRQGGEYVKQVAADQ